MSLKESNININWEKELSEIKSIKESANLAQQLSEQVKYINIFINIIKSTKSAIAWRSAWVLDIFERHNKKALLPYINQITEILLQTPHHGVQRHLTRILSSIHPKYLTDGRIIDSCFNWLLNPNTPVAIKVNAMQIISNLCTVYPELKPELKTVILEGYKTGTAGFKSRANKILKKL